MGDGIIGADSGVAPIKIRDIKQIKDTVYEEKQIKSNIVCLDFQARLLRK